MRNSVLALLVLSILSGLSPLAADDPTIRRGIDAFTTKADGKTFYEFSRNPIPAGFFCEGSKAFTGRVAFKGLPVATGIPGQLRNADTIIERLDDATFDARGRAVTRLQFRALSLVSIAPIKTNCGAYHVYVSLGGKQRVTTMSIHRTRDNGGAFIAPLAIDARLTFIPVKPAKKSAPKLELAGNFNFPAQPLLWSFKNAAAELKNASAPIVDTNGDLKPETQLPDTSNFSPGLVVAEYGLIGACPCEPVCHSASGHQHCYYQTDNCYPVVCSN